MAVVVVGVAVFVVERRARFDVVEHVADTASEHRAGSCGQEPILALVCPQAAIGRSAEVAADAIREHFVSGETAEAAVTVWS